MHVVDVFYTSNGNMLMKVVYYTFIERSEQDAFDILNVADHVIIAFAKDFQSVKKLYVKSDSAAAYASSVCPEGEFIVAKQVGIQILHHFNEPQRGKDQCDRESAVAKRQIHCCLSAGNDFVRLADVKAALEYRGGLPNSKVSIITIDKQKGNLSMVKIPGIQSYHSIQYNPGNMKV